MKRFGYEVKSDQRLCQGCLQNDFTSLGPKCDWKALANLGPSTHKFYQCQHRTNHRRENLEAALARCNQVANFAPTRPVDQWTKQILYWRKKNLLGHVAKRIHYLKEDHSRNQVKAQLIADSQQLDLLQADVDQVKVAQANGLDQIKADLQHLHDRLVQLLQDLQTADLKKIQEIQTQRTAESKEIVQTQARMEQLLKELLATGDEQASAWTRIEESQKRVEASVGALSESLSTATSLLDAQQNMQLEQKQVVQEVLDRVSMNVKSKLDELNRLMESQQEQNHMQRLAQLDALDCALQRRLSPSPN
eukprot:g11685.t1